MNKSNPTPFFLVFSLILTLSLSSCLMTQTMVGEYQEEAGREYVYAKGKQFWLFWGIIPLGRTNVNTPSSGNCEVITKFQPGDVIISAITGGIISSYSIKVKAKRSEGNFNKM
ncbi:MAG: hypothetical protein AAF587_33275 [Bacteroidota bacterium]